MKRRLQQASFGSQWRPIPWWMAKQLRDNRDRDRTDAALRRARLALSREDDR